MVDITGLTEETVAARIRSMLERGIIGITAIFDWNVAGYHWGTCGSRWSAKPATSAPVVAALAKLDEVATIFTVFGPVDLVVHVLCTDRARLFLGFCRAP